MREVTTPSGVVLAVRELGGSGRPTLLCHATGFHGAVWTPLAAELGEGFTKLAIDFRAHGASVVAPGAPVGWAEFAEDVLAVVDEIDLAPGEVLGVGHSMGGAALLLAEQARPGTFAGLWLYEPITPPGGTFPAGGPNQLADGAAKRRASFGSMAEAVANFASKPPLDVLRADALHAYVAHGFNQGEDGSVHIACRPEDESQIFRGGGTHHAFDHLGEVACPVIVACGRAEPGPALFAPAVAAALPAGRLESLAPLGHFGPLEAPPVCAASVAAFAASL